MLEQILNSLKSEVGDKITSQTQLPAGQLDNVLSVIGDVTKKEVTGQMAGGNISQLMNLFSDKSNDDGANQIQSNLNSNIISELSSKLGISPDISKSIASIVLPVIIGMITKKNNSTPENDSSPLTELFGAGQKGGFGSMAGKLLGKFLK